MTVVPPRERQLLVDMDPTGEVVGVAYPPDADVIVMQRVTHKHLIGVLRFLRNHAGIATVVDVDDDLSAIDPGSPAFGGLHPRAESAERPHSWQHLKTACREASLVTVSTPALLGRYAVHGRGRVVPNYLAPHYYSHPHADSDAISWPGVFWSHPNDPQATRGAMARLVREGAHFSLFGDPAGAGRAFGLEADPSSRGSIGLQGWPAAVAEIGIGIAPLADTRFNAAKCLDESTRVSTPWGIVPVAEVRPGGLIWNGGRWVVVEEIEREVPRPGLRITTELGYQVTVTPEHRLSSGGEWRQASELHVDDLLDIGTMEFGSKTQQVPVPLFHGRKSRAGNLPIADGTSVPRIHVDEVWGELLGFFVGDGACASTQIRISIDGQDGDVVDRVGWLFRQIGLYSSAKAKLMRDGTVLRRQEVCTSSSMLVEFFEQLNLVGKRNRLLSDGAARIRTPRVPEVIFRSPRGVVAAFLRGYFEADGTATRSKVGVAATSKDEELLRGVQLLLLGFGITSLLRPRVPNTGPGAGRTYWTLTLRRAEADLFAKHIGFVSARKQATMMAIVGRAHSNAYKPIRWASPIVKIEPAFLRPIDVQVEGEEFTAAGIRSHNSWLKPLELSACGVPWVGSPREEYVRLHRMGAGLMARKPQDWYRQVKRLVESPGLREELSGQGRAVAERLRLEDHAHEHLAAWEAALALQRGKVAVRA